MKNYPIIQNILVSFLISLLVSCQKDIDPDESVYFSEVIDLTSHQEIEGLSNELGIYTGRFKLHEGNVNIKVDIENDIDGKNDYSSRITAWTIKDRNIKTDDVIGSIDKGDFFVNNLRLKHDGINYSFESGNHSYSTDFLLNFIQGQIIGKNVNIKHFNNEGEEVFNETFYVPHELYIGKILNNKISKTNLVSISRSSFSFDYNNDTKNENGIIITMAYYGHNYNLDLDHFKHAPAKIIRRAIHLKKEPADNITIPSSFFEGIPQNGIVTINVGRGNGKLFNIEGKEYYVSASVAYQFRVVLN